MELSFCELRAKEVVNICDGKRLGNIIDLTFSSRNGCVTGIVVPFGKGLFSILKSNQDIFIPFNRIVKIGKDVILVELNPSPQIASVESKKTDKKRNPTPYEIEEKHYQESNFPNAFNNENFNNGKSETFSRQDIVDVVGLDKENYNTNYRNNNTNNNYNNNRY